MALNVICTQGYSRATYLVLRLGLCLFSVSARGPIGRLANLFTSEPGVITLAHLFDDGFKFPFPFAGLLPCGIRFFHQDHFRYVPSGIVHLVPGVVVEIGRGQVETEDGIARFENGTEVGTGMVDGIVIHGTRNGRDLRVGEHVPTLVRSLGRVLGRFDIEDNEFNGRTRGRGEDGKGVTPIDGRGEFNGLKGNGVQEVNGVTDAMAENNLGNVGVRGGQFTGEADEIVFTNGNDFDTVGGFIVGRRVLDIQRD